MDAVWFEDAEPMELLLEAVEDALKSHSASFDIMSIDGDEDGLTFTVSAEYLKKSKTQQENANLLILKETFRLHCQQRYAITTL